MSSRYLSSSSVFADESVLREEYQPKSLPERDEEIDEIYSALAPAARGVGANNVFIYGKAGQGKTAAVKTELEELEFHAKEESDHLDLTVVYLSLEAHNLSTTYKTAAKIYQELTGEGRPTGHPTDVVMDMMFEEMNRIGGTIIIVLDEIDQLGDDDRILYSLPRARAQGHVGDHVYPSVIGISNDLQWRDNLNPKVKSSLYDDSVLFSPYDANQLQQILRRRAVEAFQETELIPEEEADETLKTEHQVVTIDGSNQQYVFRSGVLEDDVIPLISAFSAQDTGDARQAIKYLRKAGEIAESNGGDFVTEEHAREAEAVVEREMVVDAIRGMTTQDHLALAAITVSELGDDTPARTNTVYAVYKNIANRIGADVLVKRRMRDHLLELDMQGIVNAQKRTAGSIGGPAYRFSLQVATPVATEALADVSRLDGVDLHEVERRR